MGINVEQHPCWTITCDRCDEAVGDPDLGSTTHYESEEAARSEARNQDWVEHAGVWVCCGCAEDAPVWDVGCPRCGAAEGESCKDDGELSGWRLHDERVNALASAIASSRAERTGRQGQ